MKTIQALIGVSLVVGATLLSGFIAGAYGQRWGEADDLIAAGKLLAETPEQFGDWQLASVQTLPAEFQQVLKCSGYVGRVYRNVKTDDIVNLSLLVGPAGPTAVHRPEICYSTRDYDMLDAPRHFKPVEDERPRDLFWKLMLKSKDLSGHLLHVAYAWNAGDGWVAPDHPRFSFAGHRMLYKLQIASPVVRQPLLDHANPCQVFLQDALPALDAVLFPDAS